MNSTRSLRRRAFRLAVICASVLLIVRMSLLLTADRQDFIAVGRHVGVTVGSAVNNSTHRENGSPLGSKVNISVTARHVAVENKRLCIADYGNSGRPHCRERCERGYFSLPGMHECQPWLGCNSTERTNLSMTVSMGAFKKISLWNWRNYSVVVSEIPPAAVLQAYDRLLPRYMSMQPHPRFMQLLGYCNDTRRIFTEFYKFSDALNIDFRLRELASLSATFKDELRMRLCVDYADIITLLHAHGSYLCDGNFKRKLISQFLLSDDLRLVLSDMDSLFQAGVDACTKWFKKDEKFVAPEFLANENLACSRRNATCRENLLAIHTSADVWKMPDVCEFFLRGASCDALARKLEGVHARCKQENYRRRPSAREVADSYRAVFIEHFGWSRYEQMFRRE